MRHPIARPRWACPSVAALTLLLVFLTPETARSTPTFVDLPDTTEFELSWEDRNLGTDGKSYQLSWLLGGVRALATGDWDRDGDEDVLTARFANEEIRINGIPNGERQPQFVLFENLCYDGGSGPSTTIRFRLHPNALGPLTREMFPKLGGTGGIIESLFPSIATADFNGDGWLDILVGGCVLEQNTENIVERSLLYINCRQGFTFKEIGREAGISDTTTAAAGVSLADFNNDGWLDIFMANNDQRSCFVGVGGKNAVYAATGQVGSFTHSGQTITYPLFTDKTIEWGIPDDVTHHFNPTVADYDRDGWLDIYVGLRAPCQGVLDCDSDTENQLLRNLGGTGTMGFENVASSHGVNDNGNAYGAAWGDFNNDGYFDILLANNFHETGCDSISPGKNGKNRLFRNRLGEDPPIASFAIHTVADFDSAISKSVNNGAFFFDYDLDGLQDFFLAVDGHDFEFDTGPRIGNLLFRQETLGSFEEVALEEGVTQRVHYTVDPGPPASDHNPCGPSVKTTRVIEGANSVFADFDLDGDLDLFAPAAFVDRRQCAMSEGGFTLVFKNTTRTPGVQSGPHYYSVNLVGVMPSGSDVFGSDASAIGSVVRVYAGGTEQSQQVCAGGQDGSSWPLQLTFGLGASTVIDSVVIDWHHAAVSFLPDEMYRQVFPGPIPVDRVDTYQLPQFRTVPATYAQLQAAVDAASPGDIVLITSPGTYLGSLNLKPGVRLIGDVPGVIVDADGEAVAVQLPELIQPGSVVEGLTIRNFDYAGVSVDSGGAYTALIRNCVFENPATSIDSRAVNILDSPCLVEACEVRNDSLDYVEYGVVIHNTNGASATVRGSEFTGGAGATGIYAWVVGGAVTIEGNSIGGYGGAGIQIYQVGDGPCRVARNLLKGGSGADYGLICTSLENPEIEHNVSWGNQQGNYFILGSTAVPSNNLAADPVVCDAELSLNLTSPCARFGNDWGVWVGAKPWVSCGSGLLSRDVELLRSDLIDDRLTVTSDLEVGTGKVLEIEEGVSFYVDGNDEANRGVAGGTGMNEILVRGVLQASGSGSGLVHFRSVSGTAGSWKWIHVANGGQAFLNHARILHPEYGVYGAAGADTISLVSTNIVSPTQACVSVNNIGTTSTVKLLMDGGLLTPGSGWAGVHFVRASRVELTNVSIAGNPSTMYGFYADTVGVGGAEAVLTNCNVSDATTGTGFYVNHGSPQLRGVYASNSKWGVRLFGPGAPEVEADGGGTGTSIEGCTTGFYAKAASPLVSDLTVVSPSGGTGLYTEGTSGGAYSDVTVTGGTTAFSARASGAGTLRGSSLTNFTLNGVYYLSNVSAGLDLGNDSSPGNNEIHSTQQGVTKFVAVKTCTGGYGNVQAKSNWWGANPPDAGKFAACVDYQPYLTGPPSAPSMVRSLSAAPVVMELRAYPNPSGGGMALAFPVPGPGQTPVSLRIYDVAGRLVRTLVAADLEPGDYRMEWDGAEEGGGKSPGGIYFTRLQVGSQVVTRKVVRLP